MGEVGRPKKKIQMIDTEKPEGVTVPTGIKPTQAILDMISVLDVDAVPMPELKGFWDTLSKVLTELGHHIAEKEQEDAYLKCAVCGTLIRSHPAGKIPGHDKKTGLPLVLYACTKTCFAKGQSEFEAAARKRLEERENARG